MSEPMFPQPVEEIVATLIGVYRHEDQNQIVDLLANAHASLVDIDFDNWNGGTYTWSLRLEVSVSVFASVRPHLADIEKDIREKLGYLQRLHPNDPLADIAILPIAPGSTVLQQNTAPPEREVRRIWEDGHFRLFLSHVSEHRFAVAQLKDDLAIYGIYAFVAHQDIQPSLVWQGEIEVALNSMHAMVALITADFHDSLWVDQEIGWALGRGVLVLPIRLGADPYGFAGKVQAVPGSLDRTGPLANSIALALLANTKTHAEMKKALVPAFAASDCWDTAKTLKDAIVRVPDFTDDEGTALLEACQNNSQVSGAFGVPEAIHRAFGDRESTTDAEAGTEMPF